MTNVLVVKKNKKQVRLVRVKWKCKCIFIINHRLKCLNVLCTNRSPILAKNERAAAQRQRTGYNNFRCRRRRSCSAKSPSRQAAPH